MEQRYTIDRSTLPTTSGKSMRFTSYIAEMRVEKVLVPDDTLNQIAEAWEQVKFMYPRIETEGSAGVLHALLDGLGREGRT